MSVTSIWYNVSEGICRFSNSHSAFLYSKEIVSIFYCMAHFQFVWIIQQLWYMLNSLCQLQNSNLQQRPLFSEKWRRNKAGVHSNDFWKTQTTKWTDTINFNFLFFLSHSPKPSKKCSVYGWLLTSVCEFSLHWTLNFYEQWEFIWFRKTTGIHSQCLKIWVKQCLKLSILNAGWRSSYFERYFLTYIWLTGKQMLNAHVFN